MTLNKMKKKLQFDSKTSNLVKIRDFVSNLAGKAGFDEDNINKIELAVDEACSNVVKHAYPSGSDYKIDIDIQYDDKKFIVKVKDRGKGFNPQNLGTPDIKTYLEKREVGGLGVHMMKELMDQVEFNIHPNKKNQVTLIKFK
ncbi:MAG: ATP-binding protein [bacterium]|nr:ATP-binding protein [bacterium]